MTTRRIGPVQRGETNIYITSLLVIMHYSVLYNFWHRSNWDENNASGAFHRDVMANVRAMLESKER